MYILQNSGHPVSFNMGTQTYISFMKDIWPWEGKKLLRILYAKDLHKSFLLIQNAMKTLPFRIPESIVWESFDNNWMKPDPDLVAPATTQ